MTIPVVIAKASEVALKMHFDTVKKCEISSEATVLMDDGSIRPALSKPPLVRLTFESGDVLVAELA